MSEHDYVAKIKSPERKRVNALRDFFQNKFSVTPDFMVRVPGRVNLIGEHIDYCGYGVCPMALDQDITVAVKIVPSSTSLVLTNINPNYSDYKGDINNFSIELEIGKTLWYNYVLCGIKGIREFLKNKNFDFGLKISISGNIPPGSGLSSSSALVCSSVLVTATAFNLELTKQQLADISAQCEQYIGTQGGGMDQAIAFLAAEGCAKFIEFNPLRSTTVALPSGACFVISHSLARLNKAATSDFNCRVMECKLAAKLLAKINKIEWNEINRLKDLQLKLKLSLENMIENVQRTLHAEPYSKDELCLLLELTTKEFEDILSYNTKDMICFKLKQRALHVFEEAFRVEKFVKICEASTKIGAGDQNTHVLEALGKLLTESHESLRSQYECSHENLDRIVKLSKEISYGARLTGAGWGGCAVALVKKEMVDDYIETLKREFFQENNVNENIDELIFATFPQNGACVYNS